MWLYLSPSAIETICQDQDLSYKVYHCCYAIIKHYYQGCIHFCWHALWFVDAHLFEHEHIYLCNAQGLICQTDNSAAVEGEYWMRMQSPGTHGFWPEIKHFVIVWRYNHVFLHEARSATGWNGLVLFFETSSEFSRATGTRSPAWGSARIPLNKNKFGTHTKSTNRYVQP